MSDTPLAASATDDVIDIETPAAAAAAAAAALETTASEVYDASKVPEASEAPQSPAAPPAPAAARDLNEARAEIRRTMEAAAGQMRTAIDRLRGAAPLEDESESSDSDDDDSGEQDPSVKETTRKLKRQLKLAADTAPPYPPFECYVTPLPSDGTRCLAPAHGDDGHDGHEPLWTAVTSDNHVIKRTLTAAPEGAPAVQALTRVTFTMVARYYPPFSKEDASVAKKAAKASATPVLCLPPVSSAVEFASSAPPDAVDVMLGHAQAARGLEIALATLRVGEKALVRCSPTYGYSATRRPEAVPTAAPLEFEVEVTHCEKEPNPQSLDADGRLAWAESRRPFGRALLAEGRPQAALRQYQRALTVLEHESVRSTRAAAHRALAATLLVNQAVVNAKLGRDDVVIALCSDALAVVRDEGHVKARAVRGAALGRVGRLEDAEADLKVAEAGLMGAVEKEEAAAKAAAETPSSAQDDAVAAATAAAAAVGVGGGSPTQLLKSVRASLAKVRAQAVAEQKRLKAKVDALRAPAAGGAIVGLPGADGKAIGLYDDKPIKAPVDPLRRRPVSDLKAKNAWEGAWNLAKFVGSLAWSKAKEMCCGSQKRKKKKAM